VQTRPGLRQETEALFGGSCLLCVSSCSTRRQMPPRRRFSTFIRRLDPLKTREVTKERMNSAHDAQEIFCGGLRLRFVGLAVGSNWNVAADNPRFGQECNPGFGRNVITRLTKQRHFVKPQSGCLASGHSVAAVKSEPLLEPLYRLGRSACDSRLFALFPAR
jgi:hypothetical protein